ncbi:MAG: MBL fold metallo-hydrolase, partial [bacterium]|nr:MBL fold metallo-hydrolase [bacterium]
MNQHKQRQGNRRNGPAGASRRGGRPGKSTKGSRIAGGRGGHRGYPQKQGGTLTHTYSKKDATSIPELAQDTIRIVPLGGVEEIGRNMTAIEFNDDIFIVDCGFMFQEADTPGVDYILPNTQYLEERREKIRAIIITHGHLDHIGGIPYVIDRIGNPPIYTRRLTS